MPSSRGLLVSAATTVLLLVLLEASLTGWAALRRWAAQSDPAAALFIERDETLGWRPMAGRRIELGAGRRFTTDARGWRRFELTGEEPLLLVIGDSYTHAVGVADGAVYYDVLAERLGLAVVALGVEGYGTLQEAMIAAEIEDKIPPPDLLLLQMTANDVINNSYALERRSWRNNNLLPRPYLLPDGKVRRLDPRRPHERFVLGRELTRRLLTRRLATVEEAIEEGSPAVLPLYHEALDVTARSLAALRGLFPGADAYAFCAGDPGRQTVRDLARLAEEAGFSYLPLQPALAEAAGGRDTFHADGAHWNELGHRLVGEILAPEVAPTREPRGSL